MFNSVHVHTRLNHFIASDISLFDAIFGEVIYKGGKQFIEYGQVIRGFLLRWIAGWRIFPRHVGLC